MAHEEHGCPCCQAGLGNLFAYNAVDATAAEIRILPIGRRRFMAGASALAGTVATTACGSSLFSEPPVGPDLEARTRIYAGGMIMTVDSGFSKPEAMAVKGNRILATGGLEDVRAEAGEDADIIDLKGRIVMPGLIDPHTHILIGALMDQAMDYVGITRFSTTNEILEYIRQLDSERPENEWIACRNYYPMLQAFEAPLGFASLDEISSVRPILVLNASGHIAYANRAAFQAAGVPEDVANPSGGEFVRDVNGKLTGEMRNQTTFSRVLGARPSGFGSAPADAVLKTCKRFASLGLTTVSELGLGGLLRGAGDWEVLKQAGATGRLSQRIRAYPMYVFDDAWDEAGLGPGDGDALVRIAGYKLIADGSNQGFTGLQREPYYTVDSTGIAYMAPEELTALMRKRAAQGWQIAVHGNGDKAIDNILDAVEQVASEGIDVKSLRIRIEHCSILHDEQIERMKAHGISASFLIGHVHYWGIAMRDSIFGPDKARLLDRCASCERAGVGYTIHSDFFVTDPNPLHMIEMAVTRQTWKEPNFVLAPEECASREAAIRAMTSEAAWQLGSDHEIGSLEPGKYADFVILDGDPSSVPADEIRNIRVLETWMGGVQTFQA